jgi:hypothetical protein
VITDSRLQVGGLADVVLAAIIHAFNEVDVMHRGGSMLSVMPAFAKPSARSLRLRTAHGTLPATIVVGCWMACQP